MPLPCPAGASGQFDFPQDSRLYKGMIPIDKIQRYSYLGLVHNYFQSFSTRIVADLKTCLA